MSSNENLTKSYEHKWAFNELHLAFKELSGAFNEVWGLPSSKKRYAKGVGKVYSIVKTIKFIKQELEILPERYMLAIRDTETKRRRTEQMNDNNIIEIIKKFEEQKTFEETPKDLVKFLTGIGQNFK